MRALIASELGRPDRDNEDFAAAARGVLVVLDGVGSPAGVESGTPGWDTLLGLVSIVRPDWPDAAYRAASSTGARAASPNTAARSKPSEISP